jgi:hypothetical protein
MAISELALGLGDQYGGIGSGVEDVLKPVFEEMLQKDRKGLMSLRGEFQFLQKQGDSRFGILFEYVDALVK